MVYTRPIVLTIAGFDPTSGAGLLADVKTLEQHRCMGFGVATAITVQTENRFYSINWMSLDQIKEQADPLLNNYDVQVVKIGIIENLETLNAIVDWLIVKKPDIKIIWDTVLSASASGFHFIEHFERQQLIMILEKLFLITPNMNEVLTLTGLDDVQQAAQRLTTYCSVYLKGGHSQTSRGTDFLYTQNRTTTFQPKLTHLPAKHGSGCILSSAIAANSALGHNLVDACQKAKAYIEKVLNSNQQLLAYHYV